MFRQRTLGAALVLSMLVVGITEYAKSGFEPCSDKMVEMTYCAECRQWLIYWGSWSRCTEPVDPSSCLGWMPNSVTDCTSVNHNCPGPAYFYDDMDMTCIYEPVDSYENCILRLYSNAVTSAAQNGCD